VRRRIATVSSVALFVAVGLFVPSTALAAAGIDIVKFVNGQDANSPTGPHVAVGSTVTFTYVVTNTGDVPLANVVVSDDKLGPITSFTGDTNGNGLLDLTETWTYTQTATALAGQQTNVGTATGEDAGTPVTDTDPGNYFGDAPAPSTAPTPSIAPIPTPPPTDTAVSVGRDTSVPWFPLALAVAGFATILVLALRRRLTRTGPGSVDESL
jgi:hypothetical protein